MPDCCPNQIPPGHVHMTKEEGRGFGKVDNQTKFEAEQFFLCNLPHNINQKDYSYND